MTEKQKPADALRALYADQMEMPLAALRAIEALEEAERALYLTYSILAAERYRQGGQPFTGKWSFAHIEGQHTVGEALNRAVDTLFKLRGQA